MLKHILTGNEFSATELRNLLALAQAIKSKPEDYYTVLQHKHLALLFDKPSLRTRMSFTVAMQQLGGYVVESVADTRKAETPQDQIRVLQGYCDAVMVRTFADEYIAAMLEYATIPVINGLTDLYHPCQILADLLTLQENFLHLSKITLTYIGDGNNILHSLLLMAPKLGIKIKYSCPDSRGPNKLILQQALQQFGTEFITAVSHPAEAVINSQAVYTDVWTSMGFAAQDETVFNAYQINEQLMQFAAPEAIFLHCMPMQRGKEVSETLPEHKCSRVFQQSENRLHVQKALLCELVSS